ncbi:MAG TPA: TIGR03086 family metal-binding protein [Nocardioides sp.]|uniref:TIGR03086 family metal-binding protein n=1 Tax=Nocardioides sp. TaxID=35761 RepID=UPI002E34C370|nr:TIGR03086 family metal-binding protein [Nocardioides sp.]HEX5090749.1 TIGR03086 family metal-binding protein [Nocardioides sp.]
MAPSELVSAAPARRHELIAGDFARRVHGVRDWSAPAPVPGWTATDVVAHLVDWLRGFVASGSDVRLPDVPPPAEQPAAAWNAHQRAVQELLDDPAAADSGFANPHTGSMPLAQAIDRFYTTDVFMHTWDLARATSQDDTLDPELCAVLLTGMEPIDDLLRESGQYGPKVPVPDDADAQTRMLGFIGRDPGWQVATAR